MIIIFLIFILIFIFNMKFYKKDFNENYLSKANTSIINGLFVIFVFISHFKGYIKINDLNQTFYFYFSKLGQLMVTTFLFFSGYGIYESIKKNKNYIDKFILKRFIPTFLNFFIAIILFLVVNIIMNQKVTILKFVLSIIGWDALGNSNWYMFSIFILYFITYFSFKLSKSKNKNPIIVLTLSVILYIFIISSLKERYWFDTLLCYCAGFWYSYYKDKIDKFIFKNKNWVKIMILLLILFLLLRYGYRFFSNGIYYNIISISFVLLIVVVSMKIEYKSRIFNFFGNNVFWIYILQRIPMILLQNKISNIYLYFIISFLITLIMIIPVKKISNTIINNYKKVIE